jgi:glucose-1-phosphate thymidylyltransferase
VPVANQPVLFRVIEAIRDAGIEDIGVVVGVDDNAKQVREAVGDGRRWGVHATFIPQEAPLGLAHAVKISQPFLGDERFVMFLGDNVIQGGISDLIRRFASSNWDAQVVLTPVEEPQHYGVAELSESGSIIRLVEKPRQPHSNLALVGIYMFSPCIFEAVNSINPSWRGELEITDAIQWLVDHGYAVHPYVHTGWWIDTGKPGDMLNANDHVLEEVKPQIAGTVDAASRVDSRVTVEAGAVIENSVIRGPAIIGEGAVIRDAYVGPFTSIYHHCRVERSEIEHSIVLENSQILDVPYRIADSIIGRNASVTRSEIKPRAVKMNLGDYSQVGIL